MNINEYSMKVKGLEYSMKVKGLADSLASIEALVDDKGLVCVTLNSLGKEYAKFWTSIVVHETFLDFQKLVALLLRKEQRNGGSTTIRSQESAFYSNQDKDRGRGRGRGRGHFGGHSQN